MAPELPTISESGLNGFDVQVWLGLLAPAGTPKGIIDRLHAEVVSGMAKESYKSRLAELGVVPSVTDPGKFAAIIAADVGKWEKIVRSAGVKEN